MKAKSIVIRYICNSYIISQTMPSSFKLFNAQYRTTNKPVRSSPSFEHKPLVSCTAKYTESERWSDNNFKTHLFYDTCYSSNLNIIALSSSRHAQLIHRSFTCCCSCLIVTIHIFTSLHEPLVFDIYFHIKLICQYCNLLVIYCSL